MRIWQIEPTYLTTALREHYEENPMNITRILDIAQDLKVNPERSYLYLQRRNIARRFWIRY
jgi:hypothetical protein